MNVSARFASKDLERLSQSWPAQHRRAQVAAFEGVLFRLKQQVQEQFLRGIGEPSKEGLTRAEQATKTPLGIRAMGRFVSYRTADLGGDVFGFVGWGAAVMRDKYPVNRLAQFQALVGGGQVVVTRKLQAKIAAKLRRRAALGYAPILQRMGYSRAKARKLGARSAQLTGLIPKLGAVLDWPARNWPQTVGQQQGGKVGAEFSRLYAMASRGERWR